MVTNALLHVEDCLKLMSDLQDPAVLRSCAIPQVHIYKAVSYFNKHIYHVTFSNFKTSKMSVTVQSFY